MEIKQLLLKNFANVNEIKIEYNQNVTYLIGNNGSGKSLCGLTAVWTCLLGLAKTGKKVLHADRFRFIGNYGKSAIIQLILHDEVENIDITITRKLLKNKTELKIIASDKRKLSDNFIDNIFNIFSINPVGFAKLSAQEQAASLGIDTAKYDNLKKIAYDERAGLGRDVKQTLAAWKELGIIKIVEPVDIGKLLAAKDKIDTKNQHSIENARNERDDAVHAAIEYNFEQDEKTAKIKKVTFDIEQTENKIKIYNKKIKQIEAKLKVDIEAHKKLLAKRSNLPTPADKKSTDIPINSPEIKVTTDLTQQIKSAESTNQQVALYQQSLTAQEKYKTVQELYADKQTEMDNIESQRIKYIKSCNLPFSNITIDDSGGVLINDRPFSETYFSKGEILRIGIKLAAASSPKLKYIFVPDSQSIDEKNREKLFSELVAAGFQVVAEYVDTKKQKDHGSILLRESQVVETYDDEDDLDSL